MAITGQGWEFLMKRTEVHTRASGKTRARTVGTYQVYHDGVPQTVREMHGMFAEIGGPGDNSPSGKGKRRIEAGTYPLATQGGTKYKTWGYTTNNSPPQVPRPGIELLKTGSRTEILIHPGQGFVWSIGCINPCTRLLGAADPITYSNSWGRVVALIEDMKTFLGGRFPSSNGHTIPDAHVIIEGEP